MTQTTATPLPLDEDRERGLPRWVAWVVALCAAAAMSPAFVAGYAPVDDLGTFGSNPQFAPPIFSHNGVAWFWRNPHLGIYMPLTYTVWYALASATYTPKADALGSHVDPQVFHAVNLGMHVLAALAVYCLLRRLLRRGGFSPRTSDVAAVAGGVLFGVHPIQVEAAAWATLLKETLSDSLALWALYGYVRAVERDDAGDPSWRRAYAWGTLAYVLSMLAKPTSIVTPLMALAIDVAILRRPWRRSVRWLAPWMLLAVPIAIIARMVQPSVGIPVPPVSQRPALTGYAISFYLGKVLWPARLTYEYGLRATEMVHEPRVWAISAIPLVLAVALLVAGRRRPWVIASAALFVIPLMPVLGLIPFDFMLFSLTADHYVYLSMLGVALAAAWGVAALLGTRPTQGRLVGVAGVAAVVLAALGVRSFAQASLWRDWGTFARHMVEVNPRSSLGWNAIGVEAERRGRDDVAEVAYHRATAGNPIEPTVHETLFRMYLRTGKAAQGAAEVRELVRLAGRFQLGPKRRQWYETVAAGMDAEAAGDTAAALAKYREALATRPNDVEVKAAVGRLEATTRPAK